MANKITNEVKKQQESVEEKVSSVEKFFDDNKTIIWSVLGVIVICGLIVLAWHKFYVQPKRIEAQEQLFPAEANFRANNFELALNGDGNTLGFAQVINNYGSNAGEDVYFYAGICELKLGKYQEALDYLKKYDGSEPILKARAIASQGDAYAGLNKLPEAITCYEKAAKVIDNQFDAEYLLKAGVLYEQIGKSEKALKCYKEIKDQYPMSLQGYDIDKYISRIENKNN